MPKAYIVVGVEGGVFKFLCLLKDHRKLTVDDVIEFTSVFQFYKSPFLPGITISFLRYKQDLGKTEIALF